MDTKGNINEHSKIKLDLYRLYLERYLYVLLNTPTFGSIDIHDIFAGCAVSKNEEKGSAIIAAETIKKITKSQNNHQKNVRLFLNDMDSTNCSLLRKHLIDFSFITTTNYSADNYIKSWKPAQKGHNLFFIDPHGYTQVSIENLKKLFSTQGCDFLVFIPTYHIYRFLRKEETAEQLVPIENFLSDLGIKNKDAVRVSSSEEFSDLIVGALKAISNSDYVYKQTIENPTCNSTYCLFFISQHPRGAEKFLEAQKKLKKEIDAKQVQPSFSFIEESDTPSLFKAMNPSSKYDNCDLYRLGIRLGLLPEKVRKQLAQLEKGQKICVECFPDKKRNKGGFYIGYDKEKIIYVSLSKSCTKSKDAPSK